MVTISIRQVFKVILVTWIVLDKSWPLRIFEAGSCFIFVFAIHFGLQHKDFFEFRTKELRLQYEQKESLRLLDVLAKTSQKKEVFGGVRAAMGLRESSEFENVYVNVANDSVRTFCFVF